MRDILQQVLHPRARILHREGGLFALSKPAGVLSHPNQGTDARRSLLSCRYSFRGEVYQHGEGKTWLLHRLDGDTTGVLLVAGDELTAQAVKREFARRTVRKEYHAIVFGRPSPAEGLWKDALSPRETAVTRVSLLRTVSTFPPRSLIALYPSTGFKHQLRVQCANHGIPIVGDRVYGSFSLNKETSRLHPAGKNRLLLHSFSVALRYSLRGVEHQFSAYDPTPPLFESFLADFNA